MFGLLKCVGFQTHTKEDMKIDNALCERDCLKYWEELIYTQVTQVSKHRPKLVAHKLGTQVPKPPRY